MIHILLIICTSSAYFKSYYTQKITKSKVLHIELGAQKRHVAEK